MSSIKGIGWLDGSTLKEREREVIPAVEGNVGELTCGRERKKEKKGGERNIFIFFIFLFFSFPAICLCFSVLQHTRHVSTLRVRPPGNGS